MGGTAGKGGKGGTAGQGAAGTGGSSGGTSGGSGNGGKGGKGGKGGNGGTGGTITPSGGMAGDTEGGTGPGPGTGGSGGEGNAAPGGNGGESGSAGQSGQGGEGGLGGQGGAPVSVGPNLFFSEYVEASGTNPDALEVINKQGASVDLAGCAIHVYAAGSPTATLTIALTGTLANNDVLVVCTAAIESSCDLLAAGLDLSGDDAVDLTCSGETLDVIGRIGSDPGVRWGGMAVNTQDHTLVRLCTVTTGDRIGDNPFGPAQQWAAEDVDTVSGLGSNTCATP